METIKFTVVEQTIECDRRTFVSKTQGEYLCHFDFDSSWDDLNSKAAIFIRGDTSVKIILDENNECMFADELITTNGNLYIGVCGYGDSIIKPTIKTSIMVILEGVAEGTDPVEPTPSVYEQLMEKYNEMITKADTAVSTANTASEKAETAETNANEAVETANEAKELASGLDTKIANETSRAKAREDEIEAKIPSHDNFATKDELNAEVERAEGVEETKADKTTTYTKEEVDELLENVLIINREETN